MTDIVFCVQAAREFKHLVKTMHANGIEVLLDVVYNHTGEGSGRFFSFRGIDNKSYYMMEDLNGKTAYKNYTGCGNTFNCCLLYTSPSPRDGLLSRMPSSA